MKVSSLTRCSFRVLAEVLIDHDLGSVEIVALHSLINAPVVVSILLSIAETLAFI